LVSEARLPFQPGEDGGFALRISKAGGYNANQQQKIGNSLNRGLRKQRGNFDLQKTSKIQIE